MYMWWCLYSNNPFIVYTHNLCIGRHWISIFVNFSLFTIFFSKSRKVLQHQIWTATLCPRIINTFWYNNHFFSQETKKLESVFFAYFFSFIQCWEIIFHWFSLGFFFLRFTYFANFGGNGRASYSLILFRV